MLPITGYTNRFSVLPGESIDFKVSARSGASYDARLVKVRCGDANPASPGVREQDLSEVFQGVFEAREQPVHLGSYVRVPATRELQRLASFTVTATVWPTTPDGPEQCLVSRRDSVSGGGFELSMAGSRGITATVSAGGDEIHQVTVGKPLRARQWYRVWMHFDAETGVVQAGQRPLRASQGVDDAGISVSQSPVHPHHGHDAALTMAARLDGAAQAHFNGKLERPAIVARALDENEITNLRGRERQFPLVACWDFSLEIPTTRVVDIGANRLHGITVNLPARAMTGSTWDGTHMSWQHAPSHYDAIHFHDDDLHDCGWSTDFCFDVPDDMRSGVYAMRLRCGAHEEMIPFFVRAPRGLPQSPVCVLIPTFTYVIYANHARGNTNDETRAHLAAWNARPWTPDDHREYGLSTYNFHSDGSGICHSSRLRPIISMRSGFVSIPELEGSSVRHFPADTHLLDWLEEKGHDYDVVTDEDLHAEGQELIAAYNVVLTTTHPEYHTSQTLDALQGYTENGGRLMYMGGNGFYWRVAVHRECEGVLEIRRGEGGIRAWAAEPGEYYNAFDGAYGGLWRRNGRPPQRLAGVGFTGQGLFQSSYYRRKPAADDERTAWIFEGVDDEILGDFGLCGGGAAGYELDRVDVRLGSPDNVVILASSENPPDSFVLVPEEHLTHVTTWSGEPIEDLIRADMVYFDTLGGGAVFSTGSITFCGSLSHNGYDNNISRIIDNVVHRFKQARQPG